MNPTGISNSVIKRLPRYYRFLGELKKFKILKEEASSSGVRRIKATIED